MKTKTKIVAAEVQTQNHPALMRLTQAEKMLESARDLGDFKKIIDIAEAARVWMRASKISERSCQHAEEIKLKAIRKGGEFLQRLEKGKTGGDTTKHSSHDAKYASPFRQVVDEAGLGKDEASRYQKLAAVPEKQFTAYIEGKKVAGGEITVAGILKIASDDAKSERKAVVVEQIRTEPKAPPEGPFRVIVIDPPWKYGARAEDPSHRARNPYPDMELEAIQALPVAALAHADCVLWLWTTNAFLRQSFDLLDAWGFENKTVLTWVKNRMGLGDWLRGRTEHCLMAVRGKPVVTLTNQTTALDAPLREHSRKPDEFYSLVDALCPGNKLEMFAREAREGWQAWGAEL